MKYLSTCLTVLSALLLFSCVKEFDETTITPGEITDPIRIINSNLTGIVLHAERQILSNATIQVGSNMTTSDQYGLFKFENINMDANGQLIKISKDGYFDQYRIIYPEVNKNPYTSTLLIEKVQQGNFESSSGGIIEGNKIKIAFEPQSIVDDQNQPYDGKVLVYQAPISPDNRDFHLMTPGNLRGLDVDGDDVILQSFAMSIIELESPSGISLNLKEGHSAKLTFEIADTHLSMAPEEIPLWYFNESDGYWIEDGVANKIGSTYIGDVTHFSFWNCDISETSFNLSFRLVNTNGIPITNKAVRIILPSGLVSHAVYTDSDGYASGIVPGFTDLLIETCKLGEMIPIGEIIEDTDLGDIVVDENNSNLSVVTAQIVDCNDNPLQNMNVFIYTALPTLVIFQNETKYTSVTSDANGNISFVPEYCDYYVGQLQITDPLTGLSSSVQSFDGNFGGELDLGKIEHCLDTMQYIFTGNPGSSGYNTNNVTATIADIDGNNNPRQILIQSEAGGDILNLEIYLRELHGQLIANVDSDVSINSNGVFSTFNGYCGSCGELNLFDNIRGIVDEYVYGEVFVEIPGINPTYVTFNVKLTD